MLVDVYRYLLYKALEPNNLSLLKELTTLEICEVWAGTSTYIWRQLLEKKAVNIAIGTFAVVPTRAGENGHLYVEKPVFQMNQRIQSFFNLKPSETEIPPEMLSHPLNFEEIAQIICFRTPIVEQCIHETLLFFAEALRGKKELDFFFEGLGILSVRRNKVTMNFFDDCMLQLDATGNMLPALLEDSEMLNMVAFRGKNKFTRCSHDGCIVLPRMELEAGQKTTSLKPQREIVPGAVSRRVSVYDPVLLAKQRAALVKKAEKKQEEEEEQKQSMRLRRRQRLLEEMARRMPKPPDVPRPSEIARRTREAERLAHARAQEERQLQVLMAFKRKEVEAEIQSHYLECTSRLSAERSQNPFHRRLLERDLRPSYIRRWEYDEKLAERLNEKDRKGEKTRLLERRAKNQILPNLLGSHVATSSSRGRSRHGLHQNTVVFASRGTQTDSDRSSQCCRLPPLQRESAEVLEHPLDFQEIAKIICFRTPLLERSIHETLLFFSELSTSLYLSDDCEIGLCMAAA